MKDIAITASLVCLGALAQGCLSQDTVGDTTQQDCDRQNEIASTVKAQYQQVAGQYVGTYNASTVYLQLAVPSQAATVGPTGTCAVPQPTIAGGMRMELPIYVETANQKPMMAFYPVASGEYVNGNDLSLQITVNNSASIAHCSVANQSNDLDCEWFVDAGTSPNANFQLHRVVNGQAVGIDSSRTQGTYVGSDSIHHSITAIFESREDVQPGSNAVPAPTIGGTITFDGAPFPFKGAQYDPINSTLVITIQGTNSPGVNCAIIKADTLRCVWFGKNGLDKNGSNDEVFELTKSSI